MVIQEAYIESMGEPIYYVVDMCMTCSGWCEVILFKSKNRTDAEKYIVDKW